MAVALLELTLRVYYMFPKWLRGHVLSKEDADELKSKAREFKSVLNVVAICIQVGSLLIMKFT